MANICDVTGKRKLKGNRVSHANNKTIHFQQPNIQERMIFVPELGIRIGLNVTTNGLRTLDKHGGLARFVIKKDPEKVALVKRHMKPNQTNPTGGIVEKEGSVNISNLMLVDPSSKKAGKIGIKT